MNTRRIFVASCLALLTTSMMFSIRGDIADALSADYHLTKEQIGAMYGPAFSGFTLSIIIAGSLVDWLGMRNLLLASSLGYVGSILVILFAPRPAGSVDSIFGNSATLILYAAILVTGLSQGLVEAVINPLIATIYSNDKTSKLNMLHAWWPGGLVVGGLISFALTKALGLDAPGATAETLTHGWQIKLAVVILPAIVFGAMILGQKFPATERVAAGVSTGEMFREMFRPMFLLWFACMWLTASTELGPDQWVASVMGNVAHMHGILILVYTAGIMFVLRFFAGPVAHRLSPLGLLTMCAALSAVGLFALSNATSAALAFGAATIFGVGKTYFWPTMLGVTSEQFPRGGPVLLAVMGGAGMLSVSFILPIMGRWYDQYGAAAAFRYVAVLPVILTAVFGGLYLYYRARGGYKAVAIGAQPTA
ncbi:MAG: MFS transporter [Acidobacteria bacterium]|nr:MAG: MFS transporter [Acidobacteriota bacterium]